MRHLPKQVAFVEGTKMVVGGSDCGVVYVFERKTGILKQKIKHQ